jgi:hypothetical protein
MRSETVSDLSANVMIASATLAADSTPIAIDMSGYNSCTILIEVGAGGITFSGTNKVEFVLTESDDNSSYTNVAATDIIHAPITVLSGIVYNLIAAHASATVVRLGYKGTKRYLKLLADFSGTHGTGTPISAVALLGHPLTGAVA